MSHPVDLREFLISLATAALQVAEVDAAQTDQLIFRDEWKPTPRTRSSTTQPQSTPPNARAQSHFWLKAIVDRMSPSLIPDQPSPSPPRASASRPAPASAPKPPSAAARPTSPAPLKPPPQLEEDAVGKLLQDNNDVFDRLINHPFPQMLGDGSASLDGFRYYMIQDTMYLETCARLKMAAVAWSPNSEDIKNFLPRHASSLEYVTKLKEILTSMLGVPENIIDTTPRSKNLDASEKFYRDSIQKEDAFFAYYVVLLPCVLSYWRIAERLMDNPSTVRNVIYYPAWIEVNYDRSSADKYIKFINANIMAKGGVDRWNYIFRIACQLEADLFNTGLQAPTPYQIVPDGTYSIQISSVKSVVLATQNVKGFLRPPLDKHLAGYFPSDAGSSVVGVNKTSGNNERWHLVVTKAGYTFQNLATGLYLGISTESNRQEGRILQAVFEPYYWWINPVSSQPDQRSPVYQICDSVNLRYTLHADIEVLNSIGSTDFCYTPIIAHENSQHSCQMWSVNDKFEQLEHAQICPDEHKLAECRNAELGKQLQEAQATNARFEAERAKLAAEMKELMDKHNSEMKAMKNEMEKAITAKDEASRKELEAERTKMQKEMATWEEQKNASIRGLEIEWARIQSQVEEERKEKEAARGKHQDLLRSIRAQVCHWEPFSGSFQYDSFYPNPIESGLQHGLSAYIMRYKSDEAGKLPGIHTVTEGCNFQTNQNGINFWGYEVLVGDMSRLWWATCHGRFEVNSIGSNPVPGWDKELGDVSDTQFIAHFSHLGNVYSTTVCEGEDGVSKQIDRVNVNNVQDYAVLCYKDL